MQSEYHARLPVPKLKINSFRLTVALMMMLLTVPVLLGQHFGVRRSENTLKADLLASAVEDYQNGYFEDAEVAAGRLIELAPSSERPYFLSAQLNAALGRPDEALTALETAVAKAPKNPEYRYAAALHYRKLGRPNEAINELKQAIKVWPEYIAARTLLAQMLIEIGNLEAARHHYRVVAETSGSKRASSMADTLSANLVFNKDRAQAQRLLRSALEADPDNQKAEELLGSQTSDPRRLDPALWAEGLRTEIIFPKKYGELRARKINVRGNGYSVTHKVRMVEVSVNEGLTWHEALLTKDGTQWSVPLILPQLAGEKLTLLSRARNELGQFEPALKRTVVIVNNVIPRIEPQVRPEAADLPGGFYSAPPKIYLTVEPEPGVIAYRWNRENYRIYESALTARRGENDLYFFNRDRRGIAGKVQRIRIKVVADAG